MIIGAIGAGKSTLTKALLKKDEQAVKTQSLQYEGWIVDTPGEYLENPLFYKNLMATSYEVTHLIYLQDATRRHSNFPPFFGTGISKLPIGVVAKADLAEADVAHAVQLLKQVFGRAPIVVTSAVEKMGLEHIEQLVACDTMAQMEHYVESVNDVTVFMA